MKQFKRAYRAFRMLGNVPDWQQFDQDTQGIELTMLVAAGRIYCARL
jgi:hypothetical protein